MTVYAAQAKNIEAEGKAARIRIRAERKTGQLLKTTKQRGERSAGHKPKKIASDDASQSPPTLSQLGISYDQSSQWQKLADIAKEEVNAALANSA